VRNYRWIWVMVGALDDPVQGLLLHSLVLGEEHVDEVVGDNGGHEAEEAPEQVVVLLLCVRVVFVRVGGPRGGEARQQRRQQLLHHRGGVTLTKRHQTNCTFIHY